MADKTAQRDIVHCNNKSEFSSQFTWIVDVLDSSISNVFCLPNDMFYYSHSFFDVFRRGTLIRFFLKLLGGELCGCFGGNSSNGLNLISLKIILITLREKNVLHFFQQNLALKVLPNRASAASSSLEYIVTIGNQLSSVTMYSNGHADASAAAQCGQTPSQIRIHLRSLINV